MGGKKNSALRYHKASLRFFITDSIDLCKDPYVYIMSYHRKGHAVLPIATVWKLFLVRLKIYSLGDNIKISCSTSEMV